VLPGGSHRWSFAGFEVAARKRLAVVIGAGCFALALTCGAAARPGDSNAIQVTGVHAHLACAECHGAYQAGGAGERGALSPEKIVAACARCHRAEYESYRESEHARLAFGKNATGPTCVSCHGIHDILPVHDEGSRVATGRVALTCARCHDDPEILHHVDLPAWPVEGFEQTFHGIALSHGICDVATCPSCHGAHDVFRAGDPRSRVNIGNVERTCQRCHSGVTRAMVKEVQHGAGNPGREGFLQRIRLYFPVAHTAVNPFLIAGMGALVGFLSGIFGVGGGFLMTPLLIFVGIPAAVAAATDAAQITAGATSGALSHSRLGNVDFKMGLFIVAGGWTGGSVGVQLVRILRAVGNFDFCLKTAYVLVLGFIGLTMLREGMRVWRGRGASGEPSRGALSLFFARLPLQVQFPKSALRCSLLLPVAAGFLVGLLAAFLGVGGGFIMLPTMIYIIGIPTRVAVGTDLFQIVLTSANVTLQQSVANHTVDVLLAVALFVGSVIGAQFGVMASRRLRGEQIRVFLAVIVLVVMAIFLYQLLTPPARLIDFVHGGGGH
jgi:uncharacterized membrane protein YfcA